MELDVQRKSYRCTNFGTCSKAASQEVIELLPNERAVCPEDGYPLTPWDEPATRLAGALTWVKGHKVLLAAVVAVAVLVPGAVLAYRAWQGRPAVAATPAGGGTGAPGARQGAPPAPAGAPEAGGISYGEPAVKAGEKEVTGALKGAGGDPAIDSARKAAARQFVNAAVGFMQKGRLDDADEQLRKALAENPADPLAHLNRAIIRARQSRRDDALASVDQAFRHGFRDLKLLDHDADFGAVRALPGYREVLTRHGLGS